MFLQIIFSEECTEAEGSSYHTKHFVCANCDAPLGGQRYVMHDGRPNCCVCYEQLYAASCTTCRRTIGVSEGHMVHGAHRWHAADACYRCESCGLSLLGRAFVMAPSDQKIYCVECGVCGAGGVPGDDLLVAFNEGSPVKRKPRSGGDTFDEQGTPLRKEIPDVVSDSVAIDCAAVKEEVVDGTNGNGPQDADENPDAAIAMSANHGHRKSRKTKSVRFDPSTKDSRSPASRDVYRQYAKSLNVRHRHGRGDDCACRGCEEDDGCLVDYAGTGRCRSRYHGNWDFDGTVVDEQISVGDGVECGAKSGRHRSCRTMENGWASVDGGDTDFRNSCSNGDDCERCSTCSSSSGDSEFDYTASLSYASQRSQTLPSSSRLSSSGYPDKKHRSRRHRSKNCVIS